MQWPWISRRGLRECRGRLESLESTQANVDFLTQEMSRLSPIVAQTARERTSQAILEVRLETLEGQRKEMTLAIAEGIEHVDRAERRIKSTLQRAKTKLAGLGYQDDGVDAEMEELRLVNGGGGKESELPPVPEHVGAPDTLIEQLRSMGLST